MHDEGSISSFRFKYSNRLDRKYKTIFGKLLQNIRLFDKLSNKTTKSMRNFGI